MAYHEVQSSKLKCNNQFDDFSSSFPRYADLKAAETHIIRASLLLCHTTISRLGAILSSDEHERAARIYLAEHRRRYIASRGLLRSILGTYLDAAPRSLRFTHGSKGKPGLDCNEYTNRVMFSVSHSDGLALYAIARDGMVGVDVEHIRCGIDLDRIARNFFSRAEYAAYINLPQNEKTEAFFRCWTRREAFIKAIGEGWMYPLERFDVSIGGRPELLRLDGNSALCGKWSIHHLNPAEGFIGALAVSGTSDTVRTFTYEEDRFRLDRAIAHG